jgi:hypothetical protein
MILKQEFSGVEMLGIFEGYPKSDIVKFNASVNAAGWDKAQWSKVSDQIFYSYTKAVKNMGLPRWEPSNASGAGATIEYIKKETGLPRDKIYAYVLNLYAMMKAGKLDPKYWNPKTGGSIENYGLKQAAKNIAARLKPAGAFVSPVTAGAGKMWTGLLVAGGLAAVLAVMGKTYINKKVI